MKDARQGSGLSRQKLVAMLSESLGEDTALQVVEEATRRLSLEGSEYGRDEVLAILDLLTQREGLVAIVARFAKARAILLMGSERGADPSR